MQEKGQVVHWNDQAGYGFILPDSPDYDDNIFVHCSAIRMDGHRSLLVGDTVTFDVENSPRGRGLQAACVSVIHEG